MSNSALITLVGNDVRKADELVMIFAKLVLSYLVESHKEERIDDNITTIESSAGTSKSSTFAVRFCQ